MESMVNLFKNVPATVPVNTGSVMLPGGLFSESVIPLALFPDVDTSQLPVSVSEAWRVPAVVRALQLYSSLSSRLPLRGAPWLTHKINGVVSPDLTIAQIIQDLVLVGASVLAVVREDGQIVNGRRIHPDEWSVTSDGHVAISGQVQPDSSVIYIPSLLPYGLCDYGRDTIRQYLSIAKTMSNRTASPAPAHILQPTPQFSGTEAEIETAVEDLADVLANGRGGIVYLPAELTLTPYEQSDSNGLYIAARNAVRTDVGNLTGLPASILDGTQSGSSEVYNNALQSDRELVELSLKTWTEAITSRLSQDDVTPNGRVSFDYSALEPLQQTANGMSLPRKEDGYTPADSPADDPNEGLNE